MTKHDNPIDEAVAAQIHSPIEVELELEGSQFTLVMRRSYPHDPQKIWAMLTDPKRLARWSPIVPNRPLTEQGPASCRENPEDDPVDAEVLVADEPRRLVHRWGAELLTWTVSPDGDGSILELRETVGDREFASRYAGGWQVCLGRLAAEEADVEHERVVGERARDYGFDAMEAQYRSAFLEVTKGRE